MTAALQEGGCTLTKNASHCNAAATRKLKITVVLDWALIRLEFGSGLALIWFGFRLDLVWIWLGFGLGLAWIWLGIASKPQSLEPYDSDDSGRLET